MTIRAIEKSRRQLRKAKNRRKRNHGRCLLSGREWRAIKQKFEGRCAYCSIVSPRLTRDHLAPVRRGGTWAPENIVPSCHGCNQSKGSLLLWRQWIPANPHAELLACAPRPAWCRGYPGPVKA